MCDMKLDKRREKCEVRVSPSEKQKIQELASQLGLSVSAMIRQILIQKHSLVSEPEFRTILAEIRDNLARISNNLNEQHPPVVVSLQTDVQQLKKTIAEIKKNKS